MKTEVGKSEKVKIAVIKLEKKSLDRLEMMSTQSFPVVGLRAQPLPPKSAPGVGRSTTVLGKHKRKEMNFYGFVCISFQCYNFLLVHVKLFLMMMMMLLTISLNNGGDRNNEYEYTRSQSLELEFRVSTGSFSRRICLPMVW